MASIDLTIRLTESEIDMVKAFIAGEDVFGEDEHSDAVWELMEEVASVYEATA